MLYVFHGLDTQTAAKKAHALIDSLRAKRPDAAFEKMDGDSWNPSVLEGHLGGQGLFSSKYIVFLDRVTENAEAKERIIDFIPAMQGSPNIFMVLEGKLNAELKRAFEKDAEKAIECEPKARDASFQKDEFNIFALANAVGRREPLTAWSIYRQAVDAGSLRRISSASYSGKRNPCRRPHSPETSRSYITRATAARATLSSAWRGCF